MSHLKEHKEKNKRWIKPDGLHHHKGYWCIYITRGSSTKITDNKNNAAKYKRQAWWQHYERKNSERKYNSERLRP